jgi:glycosyltransferase involved in cell wall biosynthesis
MYVCHVTPRYCPYIGGVETHVGEISRRLQKRGVDVDVLTTDPSGKLQRIETIDNITVRRFPSFAPNEAYFLSIQLEQYLRKHAKLYDIVHAHCYSAFPSLHVARTKSTNKLVFTPHYHGTGHTFFRNLLHYPYRFLGAQTFKKADRIICVSRYEKSLLLKRFKRFEEKIIVIPNGIDVSEIRGYKKKPKVGRTILYVGRLEKYKGVHHLVQVLPSLSSDIRLQIVGKGPYQDSLLRMSRQLELDSRVEFLHDLRRDELFQIYADADLFALLSNHEAYGITVAEALCSRVPCIVANASALRELVDGKNCYGIDLPIDLVELRDLVNSVIGRKVEELKFFEWNEITDQLLKVYADVLNSHRN